jgi:hypothetical protein
MVDLEVMDLKKVRLGGTGLEVSRVGMGSILDGFTRLSFLA